MNKPGQKKVIHNVELGCIILIVIMVFIAGSVVCRVINLNILSQSSLLHKTSISQKAAI